MLHLAQYSAESSFIHSRKSLNQRVEKAHRAGVTAYAKQQVSNAIHPGPFRIICNAWRRHVVHYHMYNSPAHRVTDSWEAWLDWGVILRTFLLEAVILFSYEGEIHLVSALEGKKLYRLSIISSEVHSIFIQSDDYTRAGLIWHCFLYKPNSRMAITSNFKL